MSPYVRTIVQKNPKTGKFECSIVIKGGNKRQFIETGGFYFGAFRSSGIVFPIWFDGDSTTTTHKVIITDKRPESGNIGTTEQWLIKGYFTENGQEFEGYYNTKTSSGVIRFID